MSSFRPISRYVETAYPTRDVKPLTIKGGAVYFKLDGEDQCIPCDKWRTIAENMRAIEKTIEALRGLERWRAKEMVNAPFRGFKGSTSQRHGDPSTKCRGLPHRRPGHYPCCI